MYLDLPSIRTAFQYLSKARVHQSFAGYLCIKREAKLVGANEELRPKFKETFDLFLRVSGHAAKPYAVPFADHRGGGWSPLFNSNVAGSYAGSSLRPNSPLHKVCLITGSRQQQRFALRPDHADAALTHMLFGSKLFVQPLAIFLYRNFRLEGSKDEGIVGLVDLFRGEFGFRSAVSSEAKEFDTLFESSELKIQQLFVDGI